MGVLPGRERPMARRNALVAGRRPLLAAMLAAAAWPARAQAWPTRPVRLLVGFPPGGASDIFARLLQPRVSAELGQPLVVENRPGAAGLLAVEQTARAPADGYTIGFAISTIASAPALYRRLGFDPLRDLAPVTMAFRMANVLVVPAASPHRDFGELLAAMRARPGQITWAMGGGPGSSHHFAGAELARRAGVDIVQVNYRGGGPAANALIAGEVAMGFATLNSIIPFIRSGAVRALAVTSPTRAPALPEVPAIAEFGMPGYDAVDWFAFIAPAGTPPEILQRLHAAFVAAVESERARLEALGAEPVLDGPDRFASFLAAEVRRMAEIVRTNGITVE
jgi:tripartite-type tricarboxylate transporter receptor subunit TctC